MKEAELYSLVGARIRARREQIGSSQSALAASVGLERTSITNIEAGRQRVQLHTLYAIAEALRVPVSGLLPASHPLGLLPAELEWVAEVLGRNAVAR